MTGFMKNGNEILETSIDIDNSNYNDRLGVIDHSSTAAEMLLAKKMRNEIAAKMWVQYSKKQVHS